MIYGSVCSGIEAASVAWHPLGWRASFLSEIDPAPRAVLAHRYPEVPLHGDFATIQAGDYPAIDLLVGGTPCQDYSVAGKRAGLDGARGRLTLEFLRLAERLRPRWVVWENVLGAMSSNRGRDFGAVLRELAKFGYQCAWRVLDAQYVRVDGYPRAVPQRRRRVFVVGYLGDWRPAAAALFEPEGLQGHPPPRRKAREETAGTAGKRLAFGGGRQSGPSDVATTLAAHGRRLDWEVETFIAEPIAPTIPARRSAGDGLGTDWDCDGGLVAFTVRGRDGGAQAEIEPDAVSPALRAAEGGSTRPMVASFNWQSGGDMRGLNLSPVAMTLQRKQTPAMTDGCIVRRLSVRECERLQGFPDDWTLVHDARGRLMADGPRYKMIGNSMAVNVMRWIGQRIAMVDEIVKVRHNAALPDLTKVT